MWLDQNQTQVKACAYKANIYFTNIYLYIFSSKLFVGKASVSVSQASHQSFKTFTVLVCIKLKPIESQIT